ncbi:MAG: oligoribonuclease [Acidobacteria bacterium]|nr:MAG: oligoribonuclease [Acidobacteriota bacterium]
MERIFWVDLEMTGLDPDENVIIEFASIITDLDFKILDRYETVVFQPQEELDKMDEWNTKTHGDSGLTAKVKFGKSLKEVEETVLKKLERYFPDEAPVLAGNSIHQDRKFIDKYMPDLSKKLHYRMLDVSSFKIIFKHKFNQGFAKKETHRALDDIEESILELRHYLDFVSTARMKGKK